MPLLDTVLQIIAHPAAQPILHRIVNNPVANDQEDRRHQMVIQRLEDIRDQMAGSAPARSPTGSTRGPGRPRKTPLPPGVSALDVVRSARDELLQASGDYKEALRFARDDGMDHPEVKDRLARAEERIADVERFWLTPDRIASLPDQTQQGLRNLLKPFRRFRQNALNALVTVDDLEHVSAQAGQLATALQVASVVGSIPEVTLGAVTPAGTPPTYSQYAPDMSVDTGCLPCGRAHVAGSYASLHRAAELAQERGMTDPEVQQRLSMVQEELADLLNYDWTPEKVSASPDNERAVLDRVVEPTRQLLTHVGTATTAEDVMRSAEEARMIRNTMKQYDQHGGIPTGELGEVS